MKRPIVHIMPVLLVCLAGGSAAQPTVMQIGANRYRFVGPSDRLVADSIQVLDAALLEEQEERERTLGFSMPPAVVIVAGDANAFRQITGQQGHVAAIYRPRDDLLIFQNPHGLRRAGILQVTVRHELCHRAAATLSSGGGSHANWVEESVCEAYARSERADCAPLRAAIHDQVIGLVDYADLSRVVGSALGSIRAEERRTGFCVAIDWGQHLIARHGLRASLALSARPDLPELAESFAGFQARWSD